MFNLSDPQDYRDDIPAKWKCSSYTPDQGVNDFTIRSEYTEEQWSEDWQDVLYSELIRVLSEEELKSIDQKDVKFYNHTDKYYACGNRIVIKAEFQEYADIEEGWYEED